MTVCRFYQQGYCRFGNNCRYEHVNPYKFSNYTNQQPTNQNTSGNYITPEQLTNQIKVDANNVINGKQWLLSSYGPFVSKQNFPGFTDISFEEMRLQVYEGKTNGNLNQTLDQILRYRAEVLEKFKSLTKPTRAILQTIESVYKNENPPDPFVNNVVNFTNDNVFGNPMPSSTNTSIFGGGTSTVPNAAGSLFAEAAKNIFPDSKPTFGTIANPGFNIFTNQMEASSETISSHFIQQKQGFDFQAQSSSESIFGSTTPIQNVFSSVGNNQNNVFNQAAPRSISPSTLFSNANALLSNTNNHIDVFQIPNDQNANVNPFLTNTNFGENQYLDSKSIFGNSNVNTNNVFVNTESDEIVNVYSKTENLSEAELLAFKNESFQKGMIPENPPPLELCK